MKKMKKYISLVILLAGGFILTQSYQNCSPLPTESFTVMNSESPPVHDSETGTGSHPPADKEVDLPTRKQLVAPRTYVAGLFREIFTSENFPVANLEVYIDKWVTLKGAQFGGACNLYTSYSSRDCDGSPSNVNNPSYVDSNTVRESYRIQMCENILGMDSSINAALEKAGLTNTSEINAVNLTAVYALFYRSNPAKPEVIATLIDLNKSLTEEKATAINKWRATLTQICESPGWQLL